MKTHVFKQSALKENYDLGDKLQVITIKVLLAKRRAEGT